MKPSSQPPRATSAADRQNSKGVSARRSVEDYSQDYAIARNTLIAFCEELPEQQLGIVFRAMKKAATQAQARQLQRSTECNGPRDQPRGSTSGLPQLPNGLAWPTINYSEWRKTRSGGIIAFLRDDEVGWSQLHRAGFNELRFLRVRDPSATFAVENYIRRIPGAREAPRALPEDVRFLTLKEANDRHVASCLPAASGLGETSRAFKLIASRIKRGAKLK